MLFSAAIAQAAPEAGFTSLFDGKSLNGWKQVDKHGEGYGVKDGVIFCAKGGGGRLFTEKEIRAKQAYVKDVYGSDFFPGLLTAQDAVFIHSYTGPKIRQHASLLLIEPTPTDVRVFKQREYEFPGAK